MWVIFAGVSVLMTMTFVMEDLYYGKSEQEKLTNQLQNAIQNEQTMLNVNETGNLLKEQDKVKTVENWDFYPLCTIIFLLFILLVFKWSFLYPTFCIFLEKYNSLFINIGSFLPYFIYVYRKKY